MHFIAQSTEIKKAFDVFRESAEKIEPYRATNCELSDIEILKKLLPRYQAAYFSSGSLQLGLKTMQQSTNELQSAVTLQFLLSTCVPKSDTKIFFVVEKFLSR